MKTIIFAPNLTPDERVKELQKICYNRGDDTFMRSLTESEISVEKDQFIKLTIEEQKLKDEAKESAQSYQRKINLVSESKKESLDRINTRQREVYDKLYWVVDAANGKMNFFDRYGELIKSRNLTPDETNGVLFNNDGQPKENVPKELPHIIDDEPAHVADIVDIEDADYEEVKEDEIGVADGSIDDANAKVVENENENETKDTEKGKKSTKKRKSSTDTEK